MKPIQLNFKPSVTLCVLLMLMTAVACCIVILQSWQWPIKLALLLLIVPAATYAFLLHGLLRLPWSVVALTINSVQQLQLRRRDGKLLDVVVHGSSVVLPYLTIINSQLEAATWRHLFAVCSVIILPDAVDAIAYRRLRVWLRWA
jgi:toxin CptA